MTETTSASMPSVAAAELEAPAASGPHPVAKRQFDALCRDIEADRDRLAAEVEQLRYERRLLGAARTLLDQVFDTCIHAAHGCACVSAGDLAQRITDEIGHPVTDEPALGPSFREHLADAQEELSRRTHTLDLVRRELGATREEADRFGAELASANQQISQTKTHFNRRCNTLTARAEHAEATLAEVIERIHDCANAYDGLDKRANVSGAEIAEQIRAAVARNTAPIPGSSRRAPEPVCGD